MTRLGRLGCSEKHYCPSLFALLDVNATRSLRSLGEIGLIMVIIAPVIRTNSFVEGEGKWLEQVRLDRLLRLQLERLFELLNQFGRR